MPLIISYHVIFDTFNTYATLPEEPPNIKQAIIWLGKLGGFMNRKSDNLPGSMTLWRGYENLKESIVMLHIITSQNCG